MLKQFTFVEFPTMPFELTHSDPQMSLGSCFADGVASLLLESGYPIVINPFGTLYNPISIGQSLSRSLQTTFIERKDLIFADGLYHHLDFHGKFSQPQADCSETMMNEAVNTAHNALKNSQALFVSFGSASVFRHLESGKIVANCHKLPATAFIRERLTMKEMLDDWLNLLPLLFTFNPSLRIIFTISPVRYRHAGLHDNALSKSSLLLLTEALCEAYPEKCFYFPAYEFFMDELRDYRYYDDDLCHPSRLAQELVLEKLKATAFNLKEDSMQSKRYQMFIARAKHRPLHLSEEARQQRASDLIQEACQEFSLTDQSPFIRHLKTIVSKSI